MCFLMVVLMSRVSRAITQLVVVEEDVPFGGGVDGAGDGSGGDGDEQGERENKDDGDRR